MIKKLLLGLSMLVLLSGSAMAQTSGQMGFAWDLPDSGAIAVTYTVELYKDSALFSTSVVDTNYFEFTADALAPYQVMVAGVDIFNNQGEFSDISDIEILDFGPPSKPGKPYRVQ